MGVLNNNLGLQNYKEKKELEAWLYQYSSPSMNASYSPRPVNKAAYKIYVRNHFPLNFDIGMSEDTYGVIRSSN